MPPRPANNRKLSARLVIAIVATGALAFACGPRARSEAATSSVLASVAPVQLAGFPRAKDPAVISSTLDVRVLPGAIEFRLEVVNRSKKNVELTFPNGQTHEFIVADSLGREQWRWSGDRLFTQGVQNKLLGAGESMRIVERWDAPTVHGAFVAIARLRSSNFPLEQRRTILLP